MLRNSKIAGDVDLRQAWISHFQHDPKRAEPAYKLRNAAAAISAEGIEIGASLRLNNRQEAGKEAVNPTPGDLHPTAKDANPTYIIGQINFDRAIVKGDVELTYSKIQCASIALDPQQYCILFRNAHVNGDLLIENEQTGDGKDLVLLNGWFDFSGASFRTIRDNDGVGWGRLPKCDKEGALKGAGLKLDGCSYQRFEDSTPNPPEEKMFRYAIIAFLSLVTAVIVFPSEIFRWGLSMFSLENAKGWLVWGFGVRLVDNLLQCKTPFAVSVLVLMFCSMIFFRLFDPEFKEPWAVRSRWLRRQFPPGRWRVRGPSSKQKLSKIDRLRLGFFPRTYQQVARVFEDFGLLHDARKISGIERRLVDTVSHRSFSKYFQWIVWRLAFGHGYSPAKATVTLLIFISVGMIYNQYLMEKGWISAKQNGQMQAVAAATTQADGKNAASAPQGGPSADSSTCEPHWRGIGTINYTMDTVLRKLSLSLTNNCAIVIPPAANNQEVALPAPFGTLAKHTGLGKEGVYAILIFIKGMYSVLGLTVITLVIITWSGVVRRTRPSHGLGG